MVEDPCRKTPARGSRHNAIMAGAATTARIAAAHRSSTTNRARTGPVRAARRPHPNLPADAAGERQHDRESGKPDRNLLFEHQEGDEHEKGRPAPRCRAARLRRGSRTRCGCGCPSRCRPAGGRRPAASFGAPTPIARRTKNSPDARGYRERTVARGHVGARPRPRRAKWSRVP